MADIKQTPEHAAQAALAPQARHAAAPSEDARKPYEAPRLLKKRSVARATLFTAVGPSMTMLTGPG